MALLSCGTCALGSVRSWQWFPPGVLACTPTPSVHAVLLLIWTAPYSLGQLTQLLRHVTVTCIVACYNDGLQHLHSSMCGCRTPHIVHVLPYVDQLNPKPSDSQGFTSKLN